MKVETQIFSSLFLKTLGWQVDAAFECYCFSRAKVIFMYEKQRTQNKCLKHWGVLKREKLFNHVKVIQTN